MNRTFTLILLIIMVMASIASKAQQQIYRGIPRDSTVFSFPVDSPFFSQNGDRIYLDTIWSKLWQVGKTNKTFFADTGTATGIMTDTLNHYPDSANDYFLLKIAGSWFFNPIVSFTHKYKTAIGKDGCIVEFSEDGINWMNLAGDCLVDSASYGSGIITENFYGKQDTLLTGEAAFSGSSNGWQLSRIQFFDGLPIRTTGGTNCHFGYDIFLRFRFVSDSIPDTLDGWIIGNKKVNYDYYGSSVHEIKKLGALKVYPNPATTDILYFPDLPNAERLTISLYDVMGQKCLQLPYQQQLNIGRLPAGVYNYRVNDEERQYSGRVIKE